MPDAEDYRDPGNTFTLVVPADWDVHERYAGTLVTIAEKAARPGFAANVNVVRYDNPRGLGSEALVAESIEAMSVLLTDFILVERDEEGESPRLLFGFRQGIYSLTADQRYVLGDGSYYVVTGTTPNGEYADKGGMVAAAVDSFSIQVSWTHSQT